MWDLVKEATGLGDRQGPLEPHAGKFLSFSFYFRGKSRMFAFQDIHTVSSIKIWGAQRQIHLDYYREEEEFSAWLVGLY